jgi:hypothetical protein
LSPSTRAAAGRGVVVELVGLLVLTQCAQVGGEGMGRAQGGGMVVAQHPAAAGQGVFRELAGLLVRTQCAGRSASDQRCRDANTAVTLRALAP